MMTNQPTTFLVRIMMGLIITLSSLLSITCLAQVNYRNGLYSTVPLNFYYSYYVELSTDTFKLLVVNDSGIGLKMPKWNQPISTCKMIKEVSPFYKIQSVEPYFFYNLYNSMNISTEESDLEIDSINVNLYFPNIKNSKFDITIVTEYDDMTKRVENKHCSFLIKNSPILAISIEPIEYSPFSWSNNQYLGVLSCDYIPDVSNNIKKEIKATRKTKSLNIEIPLMTDYFFNQCFIDGEYIKFINETTFEWRNMTFYLLDKDNLEELFKYLDFSK